MLTKLFEIISEKTVLIYNAPFDIGFLKKEAERNNIAFPNINVKDLLAEARDRIDKIDGYRLENVAEYLGIHRRQMNLPAHLPDTRKLSNATPYCSSA